MLPTCQGGVGWTGTLSPAYYTSLTVTSPQGTEGDRVRRDREPGRCLQGAACGTQVLRGDAARRGANEPGQALEGLRLCAVAGQQLEIRVAHSAPSRC